jgi:hypothetical protein
VRKTSDSILSIYILQHPITSYNSDMLAGVGAVAAAAVVASASVAVDNAFKIRSPEVGMFRTTRTEQSRW